MKTERLSPNNPAFPQTRWSLVVQFRDGDERTRQNALAELCQAYWYPAYAFVRRSGKTPEDAKDLTQGFFLDLLERKTFAKANPDYGRMRTFLLTALKRFLAKRHDFQTARKRGGGVPLLSIDQVDAEGRYLSEVTDDDTPDLLFERRWADALFQRAIERVEDYYRKTDQRAVFETLHEFLAGDPGDQNYADAAAALALSENAVRVSVHRMRKRFRKFIEEEIHETLACKDDFDDELTRLHEIFQRS